MVRQRRLEWRVERKRAVVRQRRLKWRVKRKSGDDHAQDRDGHVRGGGARAEASGNSAILAGQSPSNHALRVLRGRF